MTRTPDLRAIEGRADLLKVREVRSIPFHGVELREKPNGTGGTVLQFEGVACKVDTGYEMHDWAGPYTELVRSGSFDKTLAEGADVAFLINHEGLSLARTKSGTLQLSTNPDLLVGAQLDPNVGPVQLLRSAVERGDADQMSFAFRVLRQQWSPDFMQRDILEVDLHRGDVSVVTFGANAETSISSLRRLLPAGLTARAYLVALLECRAGTEISAANMEILQSVLDMVAAADDNIDDSLEQLAALMGVPNPDELGDELPEAKSSSLGLLEARARTLALARCR